LLMLLTSLKPAFSQSSVAKFEPNYDESKIPEYRLPDPLVMLNGEKVDKARTWTTKRRAEILGLFREHMFGMSPGRPEAMRFVVRSVDPQALNGRATRKEIRVLFAGDEDGPQMDILMYL